MPLFDYYCETCTKVSEVLVHDSSIAPKCSHCGSLDLKKLISAHSSLSGSFSNRLPGAGDTGCCGSQPHQAECQGPGTCCSKGH